VSIERKIKQRTERRIKRTRSRLRTDVPRVAVFRSLNHIYVQLIDDLQQKTVASSSTLELKELKGDKKAAAREVGKALAEKAKELGISTAVFDRGRYLYHGRVKAIAEGMRESGVII